MGVLATDNFNRADANPIGGNWTTFSSEGAMQIVSNAITPASVFSDSGSWYNAISWPNDQYSQLNCTISGTSSGTGPGPAVRVASGAETYYRCVVSHAASGNVELSRAVAGSFTTLWTRTATFVDGDLVRLEVSGSTLRAFIAGVQVGADHVDGSPITSGSAGIAFSSGSVSSASGDNWEGGDLAAAAVTYVPRAQPPVRDYGETWWVQRDRRDTALVATAANPLASPLDSAWQAGGNYWHLYSDWRRSAQPQQRTYFDPSLLSQVVAAVTPSPQRTIPPRDPGEVQWQQGYRRDPLLLTTALLENELLGGADTAKRYLAPATNAARWWMPQQPRRDGYTPGLLDSAELEGPLLGGDVRRHYAAASYVDRREVPQQRSYISDPSFYPLVPPTDPLTVAYGAGGTYWHLYNDVRVERRLVPQQRPYVSDPLLLLTAQLDELLGSADTAKRYLTPATHVDRREVPQQRQYFDLSLLTTALLESPLLDAPTRTTYADRRWTPVQVRPSDPSLLDPAVLDPTTVSAGVGGDLWRRYNAPATHDDRRLVPTQPLRQTLYFDAGPGSPPLTLAWGAGGNLWHRYNPPARTRSWWPNIPGFVVAHSCEILRPFSGVILALTGVTLRPDSGDTESLC